MEIHRLDVPGRLTILLARNWMASTKFDRRPCPCGTSPSMNSATEMPPSGPSFTSARPLSSILRRTSSSTSWVLARFLAASSAAAAGSSGALAAAAGLPSISLIRLSRLLFFGLLLVGLLDPHELLEDELLDLR